MQDELELQYGNGRVELSAGDGIEFSFDICGPGPLDLLLLMLASYSVTS